jgi:hypothetical protein
LLRREPAARWISWGAYQIKFGNTQFSPCSSQLSQNGHIS